MSVMLNQIAEEGRAKLKEGKKERRGGGRRRREERGNVYIKSWIYF